MHLLPSSINRTKRNGNHHLSCTNDRRYIFKGLFNAGNPYTRQKTPFEASGRIDEVHAQSYLRQAISNYISVTTKEPLKIILPEMAVGNKTCSKGTSGLNLVPFVFFTGSSGRPDCRLLQLSRTIDLGGQDFQLLRRIVAIYSNVETPFI